MSKKLKKASIEAAYLDPDNNTIYDMEYREDKMGITEVYTEAVQIKNHGNGYFATIAGQEIDIDYSTYEELEAVISFIRSKNRLESEFYEVKKEKL